ncbi:toll/interleukin-1 receptor domain-containing protein [bacterium]|nr:toll/interleukin-1 receptor domain-containing protein [bacterium]
MENFSKRYLNELFQQNRIRDSFSLNESNRIDSDDKQYDVFLSYCYTDKDYAIKIMNLFEKNGYKVYIDLKDPKLNRKKVDRDTVVRLSSVMNRCKSLVYVHTKSSTMSKWCPWELGYMSGKKNFRCATILLTEDKEEFPRQEYLDIYPYLNYGMDTTNHYQIWARDLDSNRYVNFRAYINGTNPYEHKQRR